MPLLWIPMLFNTHFTLCKITCLKSFKLASSPLNCKLSVGRETVLIIPVFPIPGTNPDRHRTGTQEMFIRNFYSERAI